MGYSKANGADKQILRWDETGELIVIERPDELAANILPILFRQSRFASFSRQLNVSESEGARLMTRSMGGCAKSASDMWGMALRIRMLVHGVCRTAACSLTCSSQHITTRLSQRRDPRLQTTRTPTSLASAEAHAERPTVIGQLRL